MAGRGLDDEKLSMLGTWAEGLRRDQRAEVAAAGRAIELLIDEVERLNVLLWAGPLDAVPTGLEPDVTEPLQRSLRQRVRASIRTAP